MNFDVAKALLREFLIGEVDNYVDGILESDFDAVWNREKGQPDAEEAKRLFGEFLLWKEN